MRLIRDFFFHKYILFLRFGTRQPKTEAGQGYIVVCVFVYICIYINPHTHLVFASRAQTKWQRPPRLARCLRAHNSLEATVCVCVLCVCVCVCMCVCVYVCVLLNSVACDICSYMYMYVSTYTYSPHLIFVAKNKTHSSKATHVRTHTHTYTHIRTHTHSCKIVTHTTHLI